ncbi:MAG: FdhF/YdeP family oxidoreductase [Acidobacteria bacterium]|nr:FdhF/YdeP family oxidoreductase [Acidobacteriota bacterium]MCB9397300.1 FdhF/YdeP family oxidoreductase [Acidobacteriota bacterium]
MSLKRAFERRFSPFQEIGRTLWKNRDSLGHAWRILNQGVCDGCALGTTGLKDWTIDGVHLCWIRLNLLRLNTMPAIKDTELTDVGRLASMNEQALRELGRIPYPLLKRAGSSVLERKSWTDVYAALGQKLAQTDPQRMAFYLVSRGTVNETYYAFQKAVRALDCPHVDNSARICHAPSTTGLKQTVGFAATTCSYSDLIGSEWLVFFGSNAANNQPVLMKYLHEARKKGTKIAVVNPFREPGMERYWVPSTPESVLFGTKIADDFYQVKPGGDRAMILAVLKLASEKGYLDLEFIQNATSGWPELQHELDRFSLAELVAESGLDLAQITHFTETYAKAKSAIFIWSMGITMHPFGVENVSAIANLALARGFIGRPHCGLMPIRGHSGVQGGAEMGAVPNHYPGGVGLNEEGQTQMADLWGFQPPVEKGYFVTEMMEAALDGKLDLLYCVGSNLMGVLPDSKRVQSALEKLPMRVHHDIVLNPQMFVPAAGDIWILPATTRYEMVGGNTETSTERRIIFNPEVAGRRIEEARDEWRVICDLVGLARPDRKANLEFSSTAAIRREIAQCVPFYQGIETLEKQGDWVQYGGARLGENRHFGTPDGKAHFVAIRLEPSKDDADLFRLTSRRGKQFNSMAFVVRDNLAGADRHQVLMSGADMKRLGLRPGQRVRLSNERGVFEAEALEADLYPGTIMAYWPEINPLIPSDVHDIACGMPAFRETKVRAEKVDP